METKKAAANISVFFMVPSPLGIAPGQRFRFEHYLPLLEEKGIKYKISSYFTRKGKSALYSKTKFWRKVYAIIRGYLKRISDLFIIWRYDYVYVYKETTPVGPPIFPWAAAKIFRRKIIYDFDDAIWVAVMSKYNKKFSFVKHFDKVGKICRWSYKVSVGNAYLKEFADKYNKNVTIIPTVVNTETVHRKLQEQNTDHPAIGWTGSFSTLGYLNMVLPVLQQLQEEIDFTFYVIADKDPGLPLKNYEFIRWRKETETEDLLKFHIGIMPLTDDQFSKGKCGFKAIQYMALGMPAVVSPVGVNTEIVSNGEDGFVCDVESEWKEKLKLLLKDPALRQRTGHSARKKIESKYSVKVTEQLFLNLFTNEIVRGIGVFFAISLCG
jgi:glycosyltransferase involved in cell wall biosynthesis